MSVQNYQMTDESTSKTLLDKKWPHMLQKAIDNKHINYQQYSTFENIERIGHGTMG